VTEASFTGGRPTGRTPLGAIAVDASDLHLLVAQHRDRYGERFFDGDVIILEREGARIWIFHHEGRYALL
jgi:hypothetical protein